MGSLAERDSEPQEGEEVKGILVTHNFHSKIVSPEDLSTYTPLRVGSVKSKLHVPYAGSLITLRLFLNEMYANVTEKEEEEDSTVDDDGGPMTVFGLHGGEVRTTKLSVLPHLMTAISFWSFSTFINALYPILLGECQA